MAIQQDCLLTILKIRCCWLCCCLLLPWLGAVLAAADEISLVRVGEVWRYACVTNAPSEPLGMWRENDFDDSVWQQAASGFSTVTAYPYRQATSWPKNCRSIFLRHKFMVADPASIKWLVLRLDYSDGFVAYLNGQEIARRGLTNNPVAFDDYADFHMGGADDLGDSTEELDVSAATSALRSGENVLAIEVHTAVTNKPGLAFVNYMMLVPELLANFQRGPFLQNASTNSIQVIWRTPVPADSVVEFGTNQTLGAEISEAELTTNHVVTLTNLLPGTRYSYRVRSTASTVTAVSPTNSFSTFKVSGDLTFLTFGDAGDGSVASMQLAGTMEQAGADLVVLCGDVMHYVVYHEGQEDLRCLSVYGRLMRSLPFYFAMGDHELEGDPSGKWFDSTFYLPTNSATGTEHFYSFDHGEAHFVVLYVPTLEAATTVLTNDELYEGSAQFGWLTNDLATSSKPWKFIFLHHPLATSGNHRTDTYNENNPHFGTGLFDWQVLQNLLLPVAQRYGVQMFFAGHSHDYERFLPIGGVYLSVNGCGSRVNTGIDQTPVFWGGGRDAASCQFYSTSDESRFTKVTIHGDSLLLQGIGTNGTVFDSLTLQRALPPEQVYEADWNSPPVADSPANDGRGNVTGQTFEFTGTPIPALAGDFSNLGRVYVNHDATNLFIGFEQSMSYSNSTVFLFIDSPRLSGVTNLVGLGNGVADDSEGVDGLDFLENLSFTNFAPSVACLLGDEYADAQSRDFVRPGSDRHFGQGVFRLDVGFTDVAGVRLQQFNRSPQTTTMTEIFYPERNADFMEVAIPLNQLGDLQVGDTIRIAAVVGLGGCDTNAQTRELDIGFLGSSMAGSGQSNVVLGAIRVHLEPKVLNVKVDDATRAYGATNPPLTVTYSGFIVGQDAGVLSGSPVLTTPAETNSPVGVYPIEFNLGTLSNANYRFSGTNGSLTITPALLTVKAEDQTRGYGLTNPLLTASYHGFVNGQGAEIISGSPALVTTAETNSSVGGYPIVPGLGTLGLSDTNYVFWFTNGTLMILPADSTCALFSSQNPSTNGLSVTFTATVNPAQPSPATPTGSVAFLTNGVLWGIVGLTNGVARIDLASLPPGAIAVAAAYAGQNNYLGSTNFLEQIILSAPIPCAELSEIVSLVKSGPATFLITFAGTTNAQYCVLESTDLSAPMTNWTVLPDSTNIATNGVWYYTITNVGGAVDGSTNWGGRFFRARAVNPCP